MRCCPAIPQIRRRCGGFSKHRASIRQGAPDLVDGPRRADRGGAHRDARGRPAGALSGGHAKGSLDAPGEASGRQAVARGTTRRAEPAPAKAGVKLLAQEGELYVLAESRDRVAKERAIRRRQLKRLWARAQAIVDDAADARGVADETRRRARSVPHRLAPGGDRGLHRQRYVQLSSRSRQAAASPLARRPISAAHSLPPGDDRDWSNKISLNSSNASAYASEPCCPSIEPVATHRTLKIDLPAFCAVHPWYL